MMSSGLTPSFHTSCDDKLIWIPDERHEDVLRADRAVPECGGERPRPPRHGVERGWEQQTIRSLGHRPLMRSDLGRQTLTVESLGLEHFPSRRPLRKLGNREKEQVVAPHRVAQAPGVFRHAFEDRNRYLFSAAGRGPHDEIVAPECAFMATTERGSHA